MDKPRTVGKKWLANELDLQFLIIRECTKFQTNWLILLKVIVYTDRRDNFSKPLFSGFKGSQNVKIC